MSVRVTGTWCARCRRAPALPASPYGMCGLCDHLARAFRRPEPVISTDWDAELRTLLAEEANPFVKWVRRELRELREDEAA